MLTDREKALILCAWGFNDSSHKSILRYFANCSNEQGDEYYNKLVVPLLDDVRAYINAQMLDSKSSSRCK